MTITDYEAKRLQLEKKMQEINEREAAHMVSLLGKMNAERMKISSQIGQLKKKQDELQRHYKADKNYIRRMCRDEKIALNAKMHCLRLEYLMVNGLPDSRASKLPPNTIHTGQQPEEVGDNKKNN